ncbi:hypothetical protein C6T58_19430 [Burkholderia multivorans]|uniref:3'-5' exoribonuclease n=1 Tax=Burkholderia multivorans TaxID=87883 RepID=UPI000CFE84CE|nr:3'-5' exoribonuclease [Burkholderia multivorans]PRF39945.1 hypothetical protein C6Q11_24310 [Burkholderia multivorans]PRG79531.1 hypothetical protein C6T58_19430 [Burkholderia multivorans]QGR87730.1 hypothetical protein FOC34_21370 [Burkholderia multivorans]
MHLFVDCEFTDFLACELISIALVADDGREFYAERSDYDDAACNAFVREAVLPQLGRWPDRIYTREGLRDALIHWLDGLGGGSVCVDDATDWDLLIDALGDSPTNWKGVLVGQLVNQERRERYFAEHGGRHHALHDARALRASMPNDILSFDTR